MVGERVEVARTGERRGSRVTSGARADVAHARTRIADALAHLEKLAAEGLDSRQISHLAEARKYLTEARASLRSAMRGLKYGGSGGGG